MPTELLQLCSRFWPRYFRWAVAFQLGWVLFLGIGVAVRILHYDEPPPIESVLAWGGVSGVFALLALFIAFRRRNLGCAEITPLGLRPYTTRHGWDIRYGWAVIESVRVKAGPFGNRWLEVTPDHAPPFKLTARPTDPAAVLDALERFAGEHHPLTRAYATLHDPA